MRTVESIWDTKRNDLELEAVLSACFSRLEINSITQNRISIQAKNDGSAFWGPIASVDRKNIALFYKFLDLSKDKEIYFEDVLVFDVMKMREIDFRSAHINAPYFYFNCSPNNLHIIKNLNVLDCDVFRVDGSNISLENCNINTKVIRVVNEWVFPWAYLVPIDVENLYVNLGRGAKNRFLKKVLTDYGEEEYGWWKKIFEHALKGQSHGTQDKRDVPYLRDLMNIGYCYKKATRFLISLEPKNCSLFFDLHDGKGDITYIGLVK